MDIFDDYGATVNAPVTAEQIIDDLNKSEIGREYLKIAENLPELILLDRESYKPELYGDNNGNSIVIYMRSNPTPERAARTLIHECTHYAYGIGKSQWAECVCVAHELMHKYNRKYLTIAEKRRIIKAVKKAYTELKWRKGGTIYGRRKSH